MIENIDYMYPYRLGNKKLYGDSDDDGYGDSDGDINIILYNDNKFIKLFEEKNKIRELKKISLFEKRFGLYSMHILT